MLLCKVLGVSKSGYYAYLNRPKRQASQEEIQLLKHIKRIYNRHKGTYGAKRIAKALKNEGIIVNHKKVERLMREANLKATVRQPKSTKESKTKAAGFVYENLISRDFEATHPNQKWVTDITEFLVGAKKRYVSAIMDLFNREILACEISSSPNYELVETTVRKAMKKRKLKDLEGVIIHSDQGNVYRSLNYHLLSKELHFLPSMSRKANCWDNAVIESFFSQLKTELPCFYPVNELGTIEISFKKYIRYFNEGRIQKRIGFISPKQYYLNYQQAA
ncbi:IS3 family transposase [Schinkia azotoformans]|nr:IS3 family transposase [Schinkia azotoformans]MEC1641127.1 IS3 family transposase [Schinkia azotoformans]MEC1947653.1 IS3 family transposase [Schinkia azotoformans]